MPDLFSDEAQRKRRKALTRPPTPAEKVTPAMPRRTALLLAALGAAACAAGPIWAAEWIRRLIGPRDDAVLMWWPVLDSDLLAIGAPLVLLVAVALGLVAAGQGRLGLSVRLTWLALGVLSVTVAGLSAGASVSVYRDRAVLRRSLPAGVRTFLFSQAVRVETACSAARKGRHSYIATIGYAVVFPDGERLDLASARRPVTHAGVHQWFEQVDRLDRTALGAVPHVVVGAVDGAATHSVACIRDLAAELGAEDFISARRMLKMTQADYLSGYAEPSVAWAGLP